MSKISKNLGENPRARKNLEIEVDSNSQPSEHFVSNGNDAAHTPSANSGYEHSNEAQEPEERKKTPPSKTPAMHEVELRKGVDPLNDSVRFRDNNRFRISERKEGLPPSVAGLGAEKAVAAEISEKQLLEQQKEAEALLAETNKTMLEEVSAEDEEEEEEEEVEEQKE